MEKYTHIISTPYTAIIFVLASKGLDPLVMPIAGGVGSGRSGRRKS